jgi:hypothetical protein
VRTRAQGACQPIAILVASLRLRNDARARRCIQEYGVTFPAGHSRYFAVVRAGHAGACAFDTYCTKSVMTARAQHTCVDVAGGGEIRTRGSCSA